MRDADGLAAIIRQFFRVPARIEEFVGHWLIIAPRDRTYLQAEGKVLGESAMLGARVWDHQSKFRIHVGPLTLAQYEEFLPATRQGGFGPKRSGILLRKLVDWVRFYLCFELDWDVRLHLKRERGARFEAGPSRTAWLDDVAGYANVGRACRRSLPGW